jgi:hypothetical protein
MMASGELVFLRSMPIERYYDVLNERVSLGIPSGVSGEPFMLGPLSPCPRKMLWWDGQWLLAVLWDAVYFSGV